MRRSDRFDARRRSHALFVAACVGFWGCGSCSPESNVVLGDARSGDANLNPLSEAGGEPEPIDELGYLEQLKTHRPELLEGPTCYDTLVLKPRYRESVLAGHDDFQSIVGARYPADDRASDVAWARSQQAGEVRFCEEHPGTRGCDRICNSPCGECPEPLGAALLPSAAPDHASPIHLGGYSLCGFVGYGVNAGLVYAPSGVVEAWKVFFEFRDDFSRTLTPDAYLEFSRRLAAAGYQGDSKIFANPNATERVRFQYNDVIVHANSPADARIAEKTGIAFFGASLAGHGRGIDVRSPTRLDWHHFLCAEVGDLSRLSDEARDFVHFRN